MRAPENTTDHTVHTMNIWAAEEMTPPPSLTSVSAPTVDSLLFAPAGFTLGAPSTGAVVLHGWNGYCDDPRPRTFAAALAGRGFPTIALSLRRSGLEGAATSLPYHDLRDIRRAIDQLTAFGSDQTLLVGCDVGALSVVAYAARGNDERVGGVALIDPLPDLPGVTRHVAIDVARWLRDAVAASPQRPR